LRVEPVRLRETLDELLPLTRELCDGKPVTVAWQVDVDADALQTDGRKLNRALGCLMSNAAKFTDAGEIRVTGRCLGAGAIEVAIADTGIGIAPGDLGIIFDDFRQVDGSFTRRFGGLGIGLTLARELLGQLGGELDIESEIGVGTTVRVRLPQSLGDIGQITIAPPRASRQETESTPSLAESA
jgi:signal transduction histidine kinase